MLGMRPLARAAIGAAIGSVAGTLAVVVLFLSAADRALLDFIVRVLTNRAGFYVIESPLRFFGTPLAAKLYLGVLLGGFVGVVVALRLRGAPSSRGG